MHSMLSRGNNRTGGGSSSSSPAPSLPRDLPPEDKIRASSRRLLTDALQFDKQASTHNHPHDATSIASSIESHVHLLHPDDTPAYTTRIRALYASIKRNPDLRADLLDGRVAPRYVAGCEASALQSEAERSRDDAERAEALRMEVKKGETVDKEAAVRSVEERRNMAE